MSQKILKFREKVKVCLRFGIYAQFEQDGHTEIGVLFPGKSFINSTLLLGDSVKTDQVRKCFSSLDPKISSFKNFQESP